jgi:hypothetical protein
VRKDQGSHTETVLFKGFECKVVYDYGNGYYEIMFGEQILLVCKSQIKVESIIQGMST